MPRCYEGERENAAVYAAEAFAAPVAQTMSTAADHPDVPVHRPTRSTRVLRESRVTHIPA